MSGNSVEFGEEINKLFQYMCSICMLIWSTDISKCFFHFHHFGPNLESQSAPFLNNSIWWIGNKIGGQKTPVLNGIENIMETGAFLF